MEKKIKYVPVFKEVPDGTKSIEIFVTKDNLEFLSEEEAIKYEAKLLKEEDFIKKFKKRRVSVCDLNYDVIFIENLDKDSIDEICSRYNYLRSSDLKVGLNLIHEDDSSDYLYQFVDTLDGLIKNLETDLSDLKKLKESYGLS